MLFFDGRSAEETHLEDATLALVPFCKACREPPRFPVRHVAQRVTWHRGDPHRLSVGASAFVRKAVTSFAPYGDAILAREQRMP
jgi:hypothetical protein